MLNAGNYLSNLLIAAVCFHMIGVNSMNLIAGIGDNVIRLHSDLSRDSSRTCYAQLLNLPESNKNITVVAILMVAYIGNFRGNGGW